MNRDAIRVLLRRQIGYSPILALVAGGATGGLFLAQAMYWSERGDADGWFWKTREEWQSETGLERYEQEGSRKKLRERGILEEERRGDRNRLYYRLNWDVLEPAIMAAVEAEKAKKDAPKRKPARRSSTTTTRNNQTVVAERVDECNSLSEATIRNNQTAENDAKPTVQEPDNQMAENHRLDGEKPPSTRLNPAVYMVEKPPSVNITEESTTESIHIPNDRNPLQKQALPRHPPEPGENGASGDLLPLPEVPSQDPPEDLQGTLPGLARKRKVVKPAPPELPNQRLVRLTFQQRVDTVPTKKEFVAAQRLLRMYPDDEAGIIRDYHAWAQGHNPTYGGYSLAAFASVIGSLRAKAKESATDPYDRVQSLVARGIDPLTAGEMVAAGKDRE